MPLKMNAITMKQWLEKESRALIQRAAAASNAKLAGQSSNAARTGHPQTSSNLPSPDGHTGMHTNITVVLG